MRRQIVFRYTVIVLFVLGTFVLGSVFLMQRSLENYTEATLRDDLAIVLAAATEDDMDTVLADFAATAPSLRITFIAADGTVLADTVMVSSENHLDRPEILEPGTVSIRHSDTVGKTMMYVAASRTDGGYLRIAIPLSTITPFLSEFVLLSLVVAACVVGIAVFVVGSVADRTIRPLRETVEALQAIPEGRYVERVPLSPVGEINQLTNELNAIARLIADNVKSLALEKKRLDFILDHTDQGLCILDAFGRVALVNRFAANLFGYDVAQNLNHDYLYLFRDKAIRESVRAALEKGTGSTGVFMDGGRHYSVAIVRNPDDGNATEAVLVTVADITKERDVEILKRDFFTNASHELKSPLTAILGASELIAANMTQTPAETADLAQRIIQEARRMNNLVSDMLDLSKYEQNMVSRGTAPIDLAEVCKEVVYALAPMAAERHIELRTELVASRFQADYEHMVQLVRNLVDNAIKYGVDGGHVLVGLKKSASGIALTVEDDGIGIPKTDQARVFERFYRVDKARSKKTGGTGLGLAIVKHLALAYQANIALESEVGKGTRITVTFPQ